MPTFYAAANSIEERRKRAMFQLPEMSRFALVGLEPKACLDVFLPMQVTGNSRKILRKKTFDHMGVLEVRAILVVRMVIAR